MTRSAVLFVCCALAAGLAALVAPPPAAAHGGTVWVDDNYGKFHIVVQTAPDLNERRYRFTIVLNELDYGNPIPNARVQVRAVLSGTAASAVAPLDQVVPPEPGQDGFYDLTTTLPEYGVWQIAVAVRRGNDQGSAGFVLPVQPTPGLTSPVWLLAFLPIAAALAIFLYFWRVAPKPPAPPGRSLERPADPPASADTGPSRPS